MVAVRRDNQTADIERFVWPNELLKYHGSLTTIALRNENAAAPCAISVSENYVADTLVRFVDGEG